ncbi:hypothetical protein OC842_002548 [Tilletia horrida]|uniref:Sas10 C-terminal domain-containing protein n=1 Tax=Tilletia horrida TaxID=155126 RepID=A0AAN6GCZ0_9BASI|nr:hypothetical protein OC842_002548 [Tilletia horrida]
MAAAASTSAASMDAGTVAEFAKLVASLNNDAAALIPVADALDERLQTGASDAETSGTVAHGVPLLALKNDTLLSYLHHLVLLTAHRLRGHSLSDEPGSQLVDNLVRLRLMLEKTRPIEGKMRYQLDKAVKAAEEAERGFGVGAADKGRGKGKSGEEDDDEDGDDDDDEDEDEDDDEIDPLAFRPNPAALMAASKQASAPTAAQSKSSSTSKKPLRRTGTSASAAAAADDEEDDQDSGVYRPPKLAPVPYDPDSVSRRRDGDDRRLPPGRRNAALLADLSLGLSSNPYELSSAGLGGAGRNSASSAQASARAKALRRMEEYEEENFTRLVMKKKDAKKRRRDEEAVALGGAGLDSANRRQGRLGAGLDEEFGDLLRGSASGGGRKGKRRAGAGDAYDALRGAGVKRAKVSSGTLAGSGTGPSSTKDLFRSGGGGRAAQSQFSKDVARSRKKARK